MTDRTPELDEALLRRREIIEPLLSLLPVSSSRLSEVARGAGCSVRTLRRWLKAFREDGVDGLRHHPRCRRDLAEHPWSPFIRKHYLSPKAPSISQVHGRCCEEARRVGVGAPSYSTVRRIVMAIPLSVLGYHRSPRKFRDKFEVTGQLYQARYPGELYLLDHRLLDVLVLQRPGNAHRPWLTAVLDQYSRAIVGYYLGFEPPSSRRVAFALRHAILPKTDPEWPMCGIPHCVRHDDGSDLVSKHIKQVRIDLGIDRLSRESANPKSNAEMERFYATVAEWDRTLPGWTGPSVQKRPARVVPSIDLAALNRRFQSFLHDYHRRKHTTTNMTPFDRWNTGAIPRLPESEAQLDLLLMPLARFYRVRRDGIHFQTNLYWSDELLPHVGESAAIRYDPLRLAEIVVYIADKRIGTAMRVDGARLTYGVYRRRRAKQVEIMRSHKPNDASVPGASSDPESSDPGMAPRPQVDGEVARLVGGYESSLEGAPSGPRKEPLKLFALPVEGEEWC